MNSSSQKAQIRGGILLVTMWLIAFLSVLCLLLSNQILSGGKVALAYERRIQLSLAQELMRSRFDYALQKKAQEKTKAYTAPSDGWGHNENLFRSVPLTSGYTTSLAAGGNSYGAIDEERFININTVSIELLTKVLVQITSMDPEKAKLLAKAIQDWRDLDVISSDPLVDLEKSVYAGRIPCKNLPFESVEELPFVTGMEDATFRALKPLVTVYGEGAININTVPTEVLKAFGLSDGLTEKIIRYRNGPDGILGTEDDGLFKEPGSVQASLQIQGANMQTPELNAMAAILPLLGVKSDFFRLPVQLERNGKTWTGNLVVDRKGNVLQYGR